MQVASKPADRTAFEKTIDSIEAQIANVGAHLTIDSSARLAYTREIKRMADKLRNQATRNRISWAKAPEQAQEPSGNQMNLISSAEFSLKLAQPFN